MAIAPDSAYADMLAQKSVASKSTPKATVTIGGAPAGYQPPSAPNYITGANIPAAASTPGSFRAAEEKSNAPFYAANPDYVAAMLAPEPVTQTQSDYSTGLNGELLFKGQPFTGTYNGKTYKNGLPVTSGTTDGTIPAASTGPTLAKNTFKNTLALFFGQSEVSKPWVEELYKLASPYYKTGSSVDEALNLALQEGRNNPNLKDFTNRFKGIFDLQDKLVGGAAVTVPTIAEFIASEAKMGEVLTQAGLGALNTQAYLGDIIGKGVNVTEFTNRINNVYQRIDTLPAQAKSFISQYLPTMDKTQLAKFVLGGEKMAADLVKELSGMEVQAAGAAQGLTTDLATAQDIAAQGYGYQESLTGFGTVKKALPGYEKLLEMRTGENIETSDVQSMLQRATFNKSAEEQIKLQKVADEEAARFQQRAGNLGSKSFASMQRGAGLI
jgi:hypothetical protein